MGLMLEEQELHISAERTENTAIAYCSDRTQITRFDHLVEENPEEFKVINEEYLDGELISRTYKFPKKYISIRKKSREISEEQREAAAERFRQMWKDKKGEELLNLCEIKE